MDEFTDEEVRQIQADADYWREFGRIIGWRETGFTGRLTGSFLDTNNQIIQITGRQRDDIMLVVARINVTKPTHRAVYSGNHDDKTVRELRVELARARLVGGEHA